MHFLSHTSLKSLLFGGFLLCAVITGFSGGTGIFSLFQVITIMSEATSNVTENIHLQNRRIQQLIPVRKMIGDILEAVSDEDLNETKESFFTLINGVDFESNDIKQIYLKTEELFDHKQKYHSALKVMNALQEENLKILEKISDLTVDSINTSETESGEEINREINEIKKGISILFVDQRPFSETDIDDLMADLGMISEMSISSVRAAMSVQSKTNRQQIVINHIIRTSDLSMIEKAKKELLFLKGRINSELVEFPEDNTTKEIVDSLKKFSGFIEKMIEAKKVELELANTLRSRQGDIARLINDIENSVLDDGKRFTNDVKNTLDLSIDIINKWQYIQLGLVLLAIFFALVIGWFVSGLITHPINKTIDMLRDIASGEGDLTLRLDDSKRNEIGRLGKWFNLFVERVRDVVIDIAQNSEKLNTASNELSVISGVMSEGADKLSEKSGSVATAAGEMSLNMSSVTEAAEQFSINIGSVSTAAGEMASTISEIAHNTSQNRVRSDETVSRTNKTSQNIGNLNDSVQEIGMVLETIDDISDQTNLLALNATIEAARAGEAGKGFAVVAGEIKALAKQTAGATLEIKERIEKIRQSTQETVSEIENITGAMDGVNEMIDSVAVAVDQQSVNTKEIAGNVSNASDKMQKVSENVTRSSIVAGEIAKDITEMDLELSEMSKNSLQVKNSANDLNQLAESLKKMVGQFKIS